jgi:predicted glycoside hydrolase/deacetylase ChbG (UPF0249 family)/folate-dependent phosphoribosylglycinamide formyltransferase PurN
MNYKQIIFNGDDLGLSLSFNDGIKNCFKYGVLQSTSIRTNGPAFEEAIYEVVPECAGLGIGVHLNLVEGRSDRKIISKTSKLCDRDKKYQATFFSLLKGAASGDFKLCNEIKEEFRSQIEIVLERNIAIDHLNSHQHSHCIPSIFQIVCELAEEYKIPYIRLPQEPFFFGENFSYHLRPWYVTNMIKFAVLNSFAVLNQKIIKKYSNVNCADAFIGILYTDNMNHKVISRAIETVSRLTPTPEIVEILLHPCKIRATKEEQYLEPSIRDYIIKYNRSVEYNTLINKSLEKECHKKGWHLTSYSQLARENRIKQFEHADSPTISRPKKVKLLQDKYQSREEGQEKKLKIFVVMDATPFYQPEFLFRIITEINNSEVCGAAVVKLPYGGKLQKYLLQHIWDLGIKQLIKLGVKKTLLQLLGYFPLWVRGNYESSVQSVLKRFSIPFRVVSSINEKEVIEYIGAFKPDIIISSNSLIFKDELIKLPKIAAINIHSSLLPAYGGILPVFRAIQFGEKYIGASVHYIVKGINKGRVISQKVLPVLNGDTVDNLYRLCFTLSFEATQESVNKLFNRHNVTPISDDGIIESYYSFPDKEDWIEFNNQTGRFI